MVDAATLQLIRSVSLTSIIRQNGLFGPVVAAANKAYVFSRSTSDQKVAVVDLATYKLSSITLPKGSWSRRGAAVTPDGSTVVVIKSENSDSRTHVLLISTATDTVLQDFQQAKGIALPTSLVINHSADPSNVLGYVASSIAMVLDLRANSPTFGQILSTTKVTLTTSVRGLAISANGSRLVLAEGSSNPPTFNVDVIDTAKMQSDPAHAVIARVMANGGQSTESVCTGFFSTAPPNTAPVVTAVSPPTITNDSSSQLQITGGNFKPGALVTIGDMNRLSTTYNGSSSLTVTVPANSAAGTNLDVVVTNPQSQDPPDQQNQSGLLDAQLTIAVNPKFQPATQLVVPASDGSLSLYQLNQRSMSFVDPGQIWKYPYWSTFNIDGKEVYALVGENSGYGVVPTDVTTNVFGKAIDLPSTAYATSYYFGIAASHDPQTGKPRIYVPWGDDTDLHLGVIDSDSASQTFHTIIKTLNAGLALQDYYYPLATAITPDGSVAYVLYSGSRDYDLGIFNLLNGKFSSIPYSALGIGSGGYQIGFSPDGKSLLLPIYPESSYYGGNRSGIRVFDISQDPMHPEFVADIYPPRIAGLGYPYVSYFQIIGDKLYAIGTGANIGAGMVFNFNRQTGNYRLRGYSTSTALNQYYNFAFSADGAYLYTPDPYNDQLAVLDATKLEKNRRDLLITNLRVPYSPSLIAVSPVPPPPVRPVHKGKQGQGGVLGQRPNPPARRVATHRNLTY